MSGGRWAIRGWATGAALSATLVSCGAAQATTEHLGRFSVPAGADQLIVVSSPTPDPPGSLATLRVYQRVSGWSQWRRVFGPWQAEIGWGGLLSPSGRREGDGATPTGVFGIGTRFYGNRPNPGGLHYRYHQLVCGDWWDEDPYSPSYNHFVHEPCGTTPAFAAWSEALWTETVAYPYFAVVRFNVDPVRGGANAPGSGIFLHSWVDGATAGCVAVHEPELLRVLRWLRPSAHPVIEIGSDREVRPEAQG